MPNKSTFTERLIIVVPIAAQSVANQIAQIADPTTDANTFTVPYRVAGDTSNTPVAYIASWPMEPAQRQRLQNELGGRWGNLKVYAPGENVQKNRQYWLFDAGDAEALPPKPGWSLEQVLSALGYARMGSE